MALVQTLIDSIALGVLYALVAMGIGLVFGVMRLVNFAHGELITFGAYTLFLTSGLPVALRVLAAVVVVVVLALAMELLYRPLRRATAARMLTATFAVSFLLQNGLLLVFGSQGETIGFLPTLNQAIDIAGLRVRWVTLLAISVGGVMLAAMAWLLGRTSIGLQMRAAAADFRTAQILGVPAQRVIRIAFVLGASLTAVVTLVLAVQRPLVTPDYGFLILVPALVGVVVGGLGRLVPATLGGFVIGFATVALGSVLPSGSRVFLNTLLFTIVIVVLLLRPDGLFAHRTRVVERV